MSRRPRCLGVMVIVLCGLASCQRGRAGSMREDAARTDVAADPFEMERARVAAYVASPDVTSVLRGCVTSDAELTIEIHGGVVTLPDFPSCVMPPLAGLASDTVVHVPIRIRSR